MRIQIALAVVLFGIGCGKTAMIYKKDGSIVEGKIVRGDESSLVLKQKRKCSKGAKMLRPGQGCYHPEETIERSAIKDIDHPGDLAAGFGTAFALAGAVCFLSVYSDRQQSSDDDVIARAMSKALIGIPCACVAVVGTLIGFGGYVTYYGSRSAAAVPKISPVALTDGEQTYYGVGLSWSW